MTPKYFLIRGWVIALKTRRATLAEVPPELKDQVIKELGKTANDKTPQSALFC